MSKSDYDKIRQNDVKKRDENYKKNVAKAGKFEDFTDCKLWYHPCFSVMCLSGVFSPAIPVFSLTVGYTKRGTELNQGWIKSATRGHTMVKTKYDFSGGKDNKKLDQSL